MIRALTIISLLVALVCVQGVPLHGHLHQLADRHAVTDHDAMHVHVHAMGLIASDVHEHADTVEIDLLGTALTRATFLDANTIGAFIGFWTLVLVVLWASFPRSPPLIIPLFHFGPPHMRRPSPRAPPR